MTGHSCDFCGLPLPSAVGASGDSRVAPIGGEQLAPDMKKAASVGGPCSLNC